ncbi:hypothetical protein BC781_102749 [Sediminitomix flava]|uniref:Uncharacterized protein n=1 Tax=Sediminitomix flava TaxID=379075 RepID=A0A315ZDK7_SEDFL|nr:hypothetical protein BC781_102749 [Sediminitomix flava]
MSSRIEVNWILFLIAVVVIIFELITEFQFRDSFDIQLHDTFIVISNLQLLLIITVLLLIPYLFTLCLKKLATINKPLKISSVILLSLIIIGLILWIGIAFIKYINTPIAHNFASHLSIYIFIFSILLLFLLRIREIIKN